MKEKIKKIIKDNYKYLLAVLFGLMINIISLDYEIYSPGSLMDLKDRVIVKDGYSSKGSFNLTYVTSRKGTLVNLLLASLNPSWDIVSVDDSRIENEKVEDIFLRGQIYLKQTSYEAIAAAFDEAGIDYKIINKDLVISYIYDLSNTNLKIGDKINSIDGIKINDYEDLKTIINKHNEGDKININVLRNEKIIDCFGVVKVLDSNKLIGISLAELLDIETNPKVEYVFKDNESGASRGLLCALDIYNKITKEDITKGRKISGTGTIDRDGNVGSIDGVKYKLKGAVKNKADIFIVPSGNYEEAIRLKEKNNYEIKIIKADTLSNVIEELKK